MDRDNRNLVINVKYKEMQFVILILEGILTQMRSQEERGVHLIIQKEN